MKFTMEKDLERKFDDVESDNEEQPSTLPKKIIENIKGRSEIRISYEDFKNIAVDALVEKYPELKDKKLFFIKKGGYDPDGEYENAYYDEPNEVAFRN